MSSGSSSLPPTCPTSCFPHIGVCPSLPSHTLQTPHDVQHTTIPHPHPHPAPHPPPPHPLTPSHTPQVAVIHDIRLKELRLFTDAGRTARPLFIVDSQRLNIKKGDIVSLQARCEDEQLTEQKMADEEREDDEPIMYGWQSLIRRVRGHAARSCCWCGG